MIHDALHSAIYTGSLLTNGLGAQEVRPNMIFKWDADVNKESSS